MVAVLRQVGLICHLGRVWAFLLSPDSGATAHRFRMGKQSGDQPLGMRRSGSCVIPATGPSSVLKCLPPHRASPSPCGRAHAASGTASGPTVSGGLRRAVRERRIPFLLVPLWNVCRTYLPWKTCFNSAGPEGMLSQRLS